MRLCRVSNLSIYTVFRRALVRAVVKVCVHNYATHSTDPALWGRTYQTSHDTRCRVDANDEARGSEARRRRAEPDLARDPRCDGAEHGERTAAEGRAARRGEGAEVLRVAVADAVELSGAPG